MKQMLGTNVSNGVQVTSVHFLTVRGANNGAGVRG